MPSRPVRCLAVPGPIGYGWVVVEIFPQRLIEVVAGWRPRRGATSRWEPLPRFFPLPIAAHLLPYFGVRRFIAALFGRKSGDESPHSKLGIYRTTNLVDLQLKSM